MPLIMFCVGNQYMDPGELPGGGPGILYYDLLMVVAGEAGVKVMPSRVIAIVAGAVRSGVTVAEDKNAFRRQPLFNHMLRTMPWPLTGTETLIEKITGEIVYKGRIIQ